MLVINVPDTKDLTCPCNDWSTHWINFHPDRAAAKAQYKCCRSGCSGAFEHGGHVRKAGVRGGIDHAVYIVPLCSECNHPENDSPFFIPDYIALVPADPKVTCNKK